MDNIKKAFLFEHKSFEDKGDSVKFFGTATRSITDLTVEQILFNPNWFLDHAAKSYLYDKTEYNANTPGRVLYNHGFDMEFEGKQSINEHGGDFFPGAKNLGKCIYLKYVLPSGYDRFDLNDVDNIKDFFDTSSIEAGFEITDPEMIKRLRAGEKMGLSISWYVNKAASTESTRMYISLSGGKKIWIENRYEIREISLTPTPANPASFDSRIVTEKEAQRIQDVADPIYSVGDIVKYADMRAEVLGSKFNHQEGQHQYEVKYLREGVKARGVLNEKSIESVPTTELLAISDVDMPDDDAPIKIHDEIDVKALTDILYKNIKDQFDVTDFQYYIDGNLTALTDQGLKGFDFRHNSNGPASWSGYDIEGHGYVKSVNSEFDTKAMSKVFQGCIEKYLKQNNLTSKGIKNITYTIPKINVEWGDDSGERFSTRLSLKSNGQCSHYGKIKNESKLEKLDEVKVKDLLNKFDKTISEPKKISDYPKKATEDSQEALTKFDLNGSDLEYAKMLANRDGLNDHMILHIHKWFKNNINEAKMCVMGGSEMKTWVDIKVKSIKR